MKISFEYHGPSFAVGVLSALWWTGIISPWWLIVVPFLLIRFGTKRFSYNRPAAPAKQEGS